MIHLHMKNAQGRALVFYPNVTSKIRSGFHKTEFYKYHQPEHNRNYGQIHPQ
jgi:hypothetical protein